MSVFRNYNTHKSGNVNANAHPNVYVYPWVPSQRNVRANPGIPSQPQRVQPHERGTFFPTSASDGGTLAPSMSSCAGCAGCSGGGCGNSDPTTTAAAIATQHSLPANAAMRATPRPLPGALRPSLRPAGGASIVRGTSLGVRGFLGR